MFTVPDIALVANVAQATAVIVAVLFGIVQLRQLAAQRRREAAFALMHSLQSPQMSRAILIIDRLPTTRARPRSTLFRSPTRSICKV